MGNKLELKYRPRKNKRLIPKDGKKLPVERNKRWTSEWW